MSATSRCSGICETTQQTQRTFTRDKDNLLRTCYAETSEMDCGFFVVLVPKRLSVQPSALYYHLLKWHIVFK